MHPEFEHIIEDTYLVVEISVPKYYPTDVIHFKIKILRIIILGINYCILVL